MKKVYQKPTMTVVKVQASSMLMQASGEQGRATVQNYNWNGYSEE